MQTQLSYLESYSTSSTNNKRTQKDIEEIQLCVFSDFTSKINFYKFDQTAIEFEIIPLIGPFAYFKYEMTILIFASYPYSHPKIYSNDNTAHPNIDNRTGEIYIKYLEDSNWQPTITLSDIIQKLRHTLIYSDLSIIPNNRNNINQVLQLQGESIVDEDKFSFCTDDGYKDSEFVSQNKTFLENFQVEATRPKDLEQDTSNDTDGKEDPIIVKVDFSKNVHKRRLSYLEDALYPSNQLYHS